MIDLRQLREHPDVVREAQRARRRARGRLPLARGHRRLRVRPRRAEGLRQTGRDGPGEQKQELLAEVKQLAADVKRLEAESAAVLASRDELLRSIPNLAEGAPEGLEEDFTVRETIGEVPAFEHPVKDHLEIAEGLRAIDMGRGAKVSGARFYFQIGRAH